MHSAYAGTQESTAELSLADRPTEELTAPLRPAPAPGRQHPRKRVLVSVLAVLMLLVGLAAGVGAALAFRGVADPSATPRGGGSPSASRQQAAVAGEPSPTSHDVIGILTAVGPRSVRVSSGSITGTYLVTTSTRITRGRTVIALNQLKVGEQVTVGLAFADSTSTALTAQTITAKAATVKPAAVTHRRPTPSSSSMRAAATTTASTVQTVPHAVTPPAVARTFTAPAAGTAGFGSFSGGRAGIGGGGGFAGRD